MAGLDPAIHVFARARKQDVDAPDKPGHDEGCTLTPPPIGLHWCRSEGSSDEELRYRKLRPSQVRDRGDPLNLIRVMPAKGQGCIGLHLIRGGNLPFP
jgi:hypothetical protein